MGTAQLAGLTITAMVALALLPSAALPDVACRDEIHRLPEPLVGIWHEFTVTDSGEVFLGELHSRISIDGCVFEQEFSSPDGSFRFRSFGYVDPQSGHWREHFVLNDGRTAEYRWETIGADILVVRVDRTEPPLYRLHISNLQPDSYEVREERSDDDGHSWQFVELTRTRRVK